MGAGVEAFEGGGASNTITPDNEAIVKTIRSVIVGVAVTLAIIWIVGPGRAAASAAITATKKEGK